MNGVEWNTMEHIPSHTIQSSNFLSPLNWGVCNGMRLHYFNITCLPLFLYYRYIFIFFSYTLFFLGISSFTPYIHVCLCICMGVLFLFLFHLDFRFKIFHGPNYIDFIFQSWWLIFFDIMKSYYKLHTTRIH
jgi:glycosyltransferase involved in cell wall biosynthesis